MVSIIYIISYLFIISEAIYTCKLNQEDWSQQESEIPVWLYMESLYFFVWIFSGCIYIFFAHQCKFRSSVKDDLCLDSDPDIWNSRRFDDFLRYNKFDYYVLNFYLSYFFMEMLVTFINFESFKRGSDSDTKVYVLLFLLMAQKFGWITHGFWRNYNQSKWKIYKDDPEEQHEGGDKESLGQDLIIKSRSV